MQINLQGSPNGAHRCQPITVAVPCKSLGRIQCLQTSIRGRVASRHLRRLLPIRASPADVDTSKSDATQPAATKQPIQCFVWKWEESNDAVRAYGCLLGLLGVGVLLPGSGLDYVDLGYFIGLAVTTIYIGAHRGLSTKVRTSLTLKQGLLAPVLCSAVLLVAYAVIKFLPDLELRTVLDAYFWLVGSIATIGALSAPVRQVAGPLGEASIPLSFPEGWFLREDGTSVTEGQIAPTDLAVAALGIGLASLDLQSGHTNFTVNNLLACLIATDILQLVGVRSFRTAAVMLVGLLMYDVFAVFGSPKVLGDNVMLTVATSDVMTGPTRLLYPRPVGGQGEASFFPFALLGLGDVAVPGLLACLALRFDATRAVDMKSRAIAAATAITTSLEGLPDDATGDQIADAAADAADAAYDRVANLENEQRLRTDGSGKGGGDTPVFAPTDAVLYQRTYFTPVMFAYMLGLGGAFAANSVTHLGQPALLYLVPCTLLAVAVTAAGRGELKSVAAFTDTAPSDALVRSKK